MCVGDWRLGRFITHQVTQVASSAAAITNLGSNPQRVGLMVSMQVASYNTGNVVQIQQNSITIWELNGSNPNAFFTLDSHGVMLNHAWAIRQPVGGNPIGVTEFFLTEDILASAAAQFQSEYSEWLKLR